MRRGVDPAEIRAGLARTCEEYKLHVRRAVEAGARTRLQDGCDTAARPYAQLLAIHPFEDGNAGCTFIALQGALRSHGLPWGRCLGPALAPDGTCDYQPFADLLARYVVASSDRDTIQE